MEALKRETIIEKLKTCETFDQQVDAFVELVQHPPQEQKENMERLASELQESLNGVFPSCELIMFGSASYNMAMKWNNVNFFVSVDPELQQKPHLDFSSTYVENNLSRFDNCVSVTEPKKVAESTNGVEANGQTTADEKVIVQSGDGKVEAEVKMDVDAEEADKKKAEQVALEQKLVLEMVEKTYDALIVKPEAYKYVDCSFNSLRTKVKGIHEPTQMCFELYLKQVLCIHQSRFMKFFFSLNENFRRALLVLKYWASLNKFMTPSAGISNFMPNYGFILLFIFYLQQKKYFPPIEDLQKDDKHRVLLIGGFNVGFDPNYTLPDEVKGKSVFELVVGFIEFYSTFDPIGKIMSTSSGTAVDKKTAEGCDAFKNMLKVDPSKMYLQDPFKYTVDLLHSTRKQLVVNFKEKCAIDYKHYANNLTEKPLELLPYLISGTQLNSLRVNLFEIKRLTVSYNGVSNSQWLRLVKQGVYEFLQQQLCMRVSKNKDKIKLLKDGTVSSELETLNARGLVWMPGSPRSPFRTQQFFNFNFFFKHLRADKSPHLHLYFTVGEKTVDNIFMRLFRDYVCEWLFRGLQENILVVNKGKMYIQTSD